MQLKAEVRDMIKAGVPSKRVDKNPGLTQVMADPSLQEQLALELMDVNRLKKQLAIAKRSN